MKQFSNKLIIDTSDNKNVYAKLISEDREFITRSNSTNQRPDSIVGLIEEVLKEAKLDLDKINSINVKEGPGSYTGLKVGVSVANALSFSLGKEVNNLNFGSLVDVKYE